MNKLRVLRFVDQYARGFTESINDFEIIKKLTIYSLDEEELNLFYNSMLRLFKEGADIPALEENTETFHMIEEESEPQNEENKEQIPTDDAQPQTVIPESENDAGKTEEHDIDMGSHDKSEKDGDNFYLTNFEYMKNMLQALIS